MAREAVVERDHAQDCDQPQHIECSDAMGHFQRMIVKYKQVLKTVTCH
jgi:hypothetical protein